ncbi:hypothetical protein NE237_010160 [Protea cynaroides]|uniref:Uroporphyrinogen decarboxylase (URO-D) domain-containing protein n=1 Tax=Protea cynaroides TaxID=273540 RepID=A0A9Q0R1E8_9MAGN|nr:hypothetical protein NE237_010160 [Protea cynaroides]
MLLCHSALSRLFPYQLTLLAQDRSSVSTVRLESYQILYEKYPSFRERSESVDLVVEISLQPWKVFRPDGVILFSDILTPLPGMNIPFDIVKGKGPIIFNPLGTTADVEIK